jgi:hydrogenase maturation protease
MTAVAAGTVIIGVGNRYRGDDGVGIFVANGLRDLNSRNVRVLELRGEGAAILEAFKEAAELILVDASQTGAPPGTIHCFDAGANEIPAESFRCSSHSFGVAEAIELARALGQLPPHAIVYGIEAENFAPSAQLAPAVEQAANRLVAQVRQELQGRLRPEYSDATGAMKDRASATSRS